MILRIVRKQFALLTICAEQEEHAIILAVLVTMVEPVFQLLFELLCESLPSIPKSIVFLRLNFMLGAMAHSMNMSKMCQLIPDGTVLKMDSVSLADEFVNFVANGMEAPI